jgi:diamine N-acetyltransferase
VVALRLRDTTSDDLGLVLEMEAAAGAAPWIVRWSRERHERAMVDPDEAHLLVCDGDRPVGFVLLAGLTNENRSVGLRRIVVEPAGRGLGRAALALVLDHAFDGLGAHRVWLDVKVDNARARRAYEAVGFVAEGVLRDALLTDGRYESLVVMSVLAHERARTG